MPTPVGQIEKKTREQVLTLLTQRLGYAYQGDWIDRPANANIEPARLKAWLASQGCERHAGRPRLVRAAEGSQRRQQEHL